MPSVKENIAALPRHRGLDELLAASEDPHPRGTRRIEWVGERSPLDDDRVLAKLLLSESRMPGAPTYYTPTQCRAIRLAAARARTRGDGWRNRIMEHSHQHAMAVVHGLRRTYYWTKSNGYVCDVDYHDADVILSSDSGHEFVDLDALEPGQPKVITPSPEVFKLVATEAVPALSRRGEGPPRGAIVAAH